MDVKRLVFPMMMMSMVLSGCQAQKDHEVDRALNQNLFQQESIAEGAPLAESEAAREILTIQADGGRIIIRGTGVTAETRAVEADGELLLVQPDQGAFQVSFDSLSWQASDQVSPAKGDRVMIGAKGAFRFVSEGESYTLYHQLGTGSKVIVTGIQKEELENYVLHPDGSRIVFFQEGAEEAKVYHTANQRITEIKELPVAQLLRPLAEHVFFSPKGGYLSLMLENEAGQQGFITYGADSGRKIHDLIYGQEPVWSTDENHIAFFYHSDKLAVWYRKTGRIRIWDELAAPARLIGVPVWSSDGGWLLYRSGTAEADRLHRLQLSQAAITHVQETDYLEENQLLGIEEMALTESGLVYALAGEKELRVKAEPLSGIGAIELDGLSPFTEVRLGGVSRRAFLPVLGGVVYRKENSLYLLGKEGSRNIFKNSEPILSVQYLPGAGQLWVLTENEAGLELVVIPLE